MKKLTFLLLLTFIGGFSVAQKSNTWIELGITGDGGAGIITNKNIWNDQVNITSTISPCYGGGIKLGINLNKNHEIAFNPSFSIKTQKYQIKLDSISYDKQLKIKQLDFPILYRYHSETGGYVEIGPMFSMINSVEENRNGESFDVTENFNKSFASGVFGFGSNFIQSNAFTWTIGFRFVYGFKDLVSSQGGSGSTKPYPINDGIYSKTFTNYQPLKASWLMLHTEFDFDLGYFGRSSCKRGRITFMKF